MRVEREQAAVTAFPTPPAGRGWSADLVPESCLTSDCRSDKVKSEHSRVAEALVMFAICRDLSGRPRRPRPRWQSWCNVKYKTAARMFSRHKQFPLSSLVVR